MLILTRTIGETVIINDNIMVTVMNVNGDRVSVGIEAPKEVAVLRSELVPEPLKDTVILRERSND